VVGFDAPYRTNVVVFPDGRVIRRAPENNPERCVGRQDEERCATRVLNAWTADIAFVIDRLEEMNAAASAGRFTGRLDQSRVGVLGHSFGGAAAAQFCSEDRRCKAGIDVDGALHGSVIQSGIDRPFMFLLSDHSRESESTNRQIEADITSVYDRLPADQRMRIVIRGANHFLFSDDGAVLKSEIVRRFLQAVGVLRINGRRQLAVTAYAVHSFFDAYLKNRVASTLETGSALYPEIQVLH
jgi:predicted dienelactone hydrolase